MEQSFGERLRLWRRRRGMTQTDLAQALGVTVQTVVRYESLRQAEDMRRGRIEACARALRIEPWELTGRVEDYEQSRSAGDAEEIMIQALTRGLRNMEDEQRDSLIRLMMPLVLQYQKKEEGLAGLGYQMWKEKNGYSKDEISGDFRKEDSCGWENGAEEGGTPDEGEFRT